MGCVAEARAISAAGSNAFGGAETGGCVFFVAAMATCSACGAARATPPPLSPPLRLKPYEGRPTVGLGTVKTDKHGRISSCLKSQPSKTLARPRERGRVRDQSMNLRPLARPPSLLLPLLRPSPLPPLPYAALFIHTRIRSTRGGGRGSAAESGGARATSEAAGGRPLYYEAAFTLPLSSMQQRLPSLPPPLFSA